MERSDRPHAVHVGAAADGTLTYLVDVPPEALPPVRLRDLSAAWEAARDAAIAAGQGAGSYGPASYGTGNDGAGNDGTGHWGAARLFRFRRDDGSCTDLALADPDACCWAGAVDGTVGMNTSYGLSLCLRLLALIDLLARASWASALFSLRRDGAEIDPAVLRTAATVPLTRDARFDEPGFRAMVMPARLPTPSTPVPGAAS